MDLNWDAIGAIGEIVGAAAVVLSLVYLAVQVRQNRLQLKTDALEVVLKEHQHTAEMTTRSEIAAVIGKGVRSYHDLSPTEKIQFNGFWVKYLYSFLNIRDQYMAGNIDASRFTTFEQDLVAGWLAPGMIEWWSSVETTHLEIRDYVNELLEAGRGKVAPYTDYMPGWSDHG
jgi:hypothetical protein